MRRSPPEYRGEPGFATWLHRIVTNRCLNLVRARRPAADLDTVAEPADPGPRSSPARAAESDVAARDLAQALDSLFAEQRVCWVLRESPRRTPGGESLELPASKGPLCGPEAGQEPGPQTAPARPGSRTGARVAGLNVVLTDEDTLRVTTGVFATAPTRPCRQPVAPNGTAAPRTGADRHRAWGQ
ncbi:RNA polymerase sigma factor [Streptomyces wedmorensis]